MKKLALSVVVAGVFLAGCGDNLPKEITSHENYKNCQEVEKNLLTIQSSFEKDERTKFFSECNAVYGKEIHEIVDEVEQNLNTRLNAASKSDSTVELTQMFGNSTTKTVGNATKTRMQK